MKPFKTTLTYFFSCTCIFCSVTIVAQSNKTSANRPPQNKKETASFEVVNLMPNFFKFWTEAKGKNDTEKVQLFRKTVLEPDKGIYTLIPGEITDERISTYLNKIETALESMKVLSDQLPAQFELSWKNFAKKFPDVKGSRLYIMPSLSTFNGFSAKQDNGEAILLFGVDEMIKGSKPGFNFIPQIQHEIAHLYHAQVVPEILTNNSLYINLWQEGLANYIAMVLNPKATIREIWLSDSLPFQLKPLVPKIAKELKGKLHATAWEEKDEYFRMTPKRTDVPGRSAYYIGELIVEQSAKKHSLQALTRLKGQALLKEVEYQLGLLEKTK